MAVDTVLVKKIAQEEKKKGKKKTRRQTALI